MSFHIRPCVCLKLVQSHAHTIYLSPLSLAHTQTNTHLPAFFSFRFYLLLIGFDVCLSCCCCSANGSHFCKTFAHSAQFSLSNNENLETKRLTGRKASRIGTHSIINSRLFWRHMWEPEKKNHQKNFRFTIHCRVWATRCCGGFASVAHTF